MKKIAKISAIALASLLGLAVLTLLVLGQRENAGRLQWTVDVGQPVSRVFPWLTDGEKLTQWVGWLVDVEQEDPSHLGVGSRVTWVMDDPNMNERLRLSGVVTAYQEGRLIELDMRLDGAFEGTASYKLTQLPNGNTRVEHVGIYRYPHWFAKLLEPVVTREAQQKLEEDLARMKQLIETTARIVRKPDTAHHGD